MRAVRLLEHALTKEPQNVLDVGVGKGKHSFSFLAHGCRVTGVDVQEAPLEHPLYTHMDKPFELADFGDQKFDLIWCSHTLEHIPNVQMFLIKLRSLLTDDGWLYIAVPPDSQNRLHVGHLTLWTPAHLMYNLVCAGWDCKEALWYSEYLTIGLSIQAKPEMDMSWRTGMPSEVFDLNQYMPVPIRHESGAWWGDNWPDKTGDIAMDPPGVTVGIRQTNIPPQTQLAFGPNPKLREGYEVSPAKG